MISFPPSSVPGPQGPAGPPGPAATVGTPTGTWDASANSPALTSGVGTPGTAYIVATTGSTNLDGITTWAVGDIVYKGTSTWTRVPAQTSPALTGIVSSGERINGTLTAGSAATGCTAITVSGRFMGFTIPTAATGSASFVQQKILLSAKDRLALAGATIRLTLVANVSANFLTKKPLVSEGIVVVNVDGTTSSNQGTLVSTVQSGTVLTRQWTYVCTGNEQYVGGIFTLATDATDTSIHTLQCVSTIYGIDVLPARAAVSNQDAALARITDGIADTVVSTAAPLRMTSGEMLANTSSLSSMAAGAVQITSGGRPVGITIPAGSTGAGSFIEPRMAITPADAVRLIGKTIRIRIVATVTANYLLKIPFGGGSVYVLMQDGTSSSSNGTVASTVQTGTTLVREFTYVMTGTESLIAGVMQIGVTGALDSVTHSFQITSCVWMVDAVAASAAFNPIDDMLTTRLSPRNLGMGRVYSVLVAAPQTFNGGAVLAAADGRNMGWQIPIGQTGQNTLVQWKLAVNAADTPLLAGRTIRMIFGCTTSASYSRAFTVNLQTVPAGGGTRNVAFTTVRNAQTTTTRRIIEITAVLTGDEVVIQPFFSSTGTGVAVALETMLLTDMEISLSVTPSDVKSPASETLDWALSQIVATATTAAITASLNAASYGVTKVIAADGTGDYTTIAGGLTGATTGAIGNKIRERIAPGTYVSVNNTTKDYVDFIGSQRGACILDGSQAVSTALATIAANSTLNCSSETQLAYLTIKGANIRYAIHDDNSNAIQNRTRHIIGCHVEHLGNDTAQAYWDAHGGGTVWASTHAYGCGTSSGSAVYGKRSTFKGVRCGFSFHTAPAFTDPSTIDLEDCRLTATAIGSGTGFALLAQPNGSFQDDVCELRGCELDGDIYYWPDPWQANTLALQPANHAEIKMSGYGNSPAVFLNADFGAALKIASANLTVSSAIAVSGTAMATLFGQQVYTMAAGGGGIPGYVYGWADISGTGVGVARNVFITTLGQRLGDCSSVNQTLTILVDGVTTVNVLFNADYTASSNATILGLINAALGAGGTASAYNVGARYRPAFRDEERNLKNVDTTDILMGMALAYTNDRSVRIMLPADPAAIFAGIAWEDIYVGTYGRVKTAGWVPVSDLLRIGGAGVAYGSSFSIDASNPGYVNSGGSQGLMRVVRSSSGNSPAVEVRAK